MNLCFVVLHYQAVDMTIECIHALRKLSASNPFQIVIVDNCSPNKSGEHLNLLYQNDLDIHVIINQENLGFARGNNIGFSYAKTQLKSDIIVVMNNDVIIEQNDFCTLLLTNYYESDLHIIAPDIRTLSNRQQNPFRLQKISNDKLLRMYYYNSALSFIYTIPLLGRACCFVLEKKNKYKENEISLNSDKKLDNIVPHGSCIIYLKEWIKNEDFSFLPITFMYMEEDILFEYSSYKNYGILFDPTMSVRHLEDVSTNASSLNKLKKRKFIANNMKQSIKKLIELRKTNRY